jgi:UTP--glucose-1-phosphate uridylyltransferase
MLPVGAKPVVQYVVEEAAASGIRRLLFITGPSKTSIENHFDLNQDLITSLRETGKESLLAELDFERNGLEYFFTRQRKQLGLGHAVLCARDSSATSRLSSPRATRSSIARVPHHRPAGRGVHTTGATP